MRSAVKVAASVLGGIGRKSTTTRKLVLSIVVDADRFGNGGLLIWLRQTIDMSLADLPYLAAADHRYVG